MGFPEASEEIPGHLAGSCSLTAPPLWRAPCLGNISKMACLASAGVSQCDWMNRVSLCERNIARCCAIGYMSAASRHARWRSRVASTGVSDARVDAVVRETIGDLFRGDQASELPSSLGALSSPSGVLSGPIVADWVLERKESTRHICFTLEVDTKRDVARVGPDAWGSRGPGPVTEQT